MQTVKTFAVLALCGAFVGAAVVAGIAPSALAWYQTPGTTLAAMCPCAELAHQIMSQLVHAQLGGALGGAVFFIIIGAVVRSRRRRKAAAAAARVVVVATAHGLKFTEFKVATAADTVPGVSLGAARAPREVPNNYDAVRAAALG